MKRTLIAAFLAAGALTASADSFTLKDVVSDFRICVDAGLTVTITDDAGQETITFVSDGTPFTNDPSQHLKPAGTNTFTVTTDGYIRNLYLDGAGITEFSVGALPRLEVLNLSDCRLTALNLSKLKELQTLIVDGNAQLAHLDLSKQSKLRKLHATGTALEELELASTSITDLWVGECHLGGVLDLSAQNHLRSLDASYNAGQLEQVKLATSNAAKAALDYYSVAGNALFFDSFPTIYDKQKQQYTVIHQLGNQKPYHYTDYFLLGEQYDLTDLIRYNAWGAAITPTVEVIRMTKRNDYSYAEENVLEKGVDYTMVGSYKYTFLTEQPAVYFRVTSAMYPDYVFFTAPFVLTSDLSGIGSILTYGEDATPAYDLQGRMVKSAAKGVLIQNGKKLIVK